MRRGEQVRTRIEAPSELDGPLAKGAKVGSASVFVDGERVRTVNLVTGEAVPKAGLVRKIVHVVLRPWTLIAGVLILALAVERRRRRLAAADAARRARRQPAHLD